jgi:hypothetical protein
MALALRAARQIQLTLAQPKKWKAIRVIMFKSFVRRQVAAQAVADGTQTPLPAIRRLLVVLVVLAERAQRAVEAVVVPRIPPTPEAKPAKPILGRVQMAPPYLVAQVAAARLRWAPAQPKPAPRAPAHSTAVMAGGALPETTMVTVLPPLAAAQVTQAARYSPKTALIMVALARMEQVDLSG